MTRDVRIASVSQREKADCFIFTQDEMTADLMSVAASFYCEVHLNLKFLQKDEKKILIMKRAQIFFFQLKFCVCLCAEPGNTKGLICYECSSAADNLK